jgi:hypothetical protein
LKANKSFPLKLAGLPDGVFVHIPKTQILVYFRGSWKGKCWYILGAFGTFAATCCTSWPFGTFCFHLVCFFPFWYIVRKNAATCCTSWPFGIFCCHSVCFTRFGMLYQNNLANLATIITAVRLKTLAANIGWMQLLPIFVKRTLQHFHTQPIKLYSNIYVIIRDRCYDFLNIFAEKNWQKKWRFSLKTKKWS